MENEVIEMNDLVSVEGAPGARKTVGHRDGEPQWEVQLGRDAGSKQWVNSAKLTLVHKALKAELEPGFYPPSIIGR